MSFAEWILSAHPFFVWAQGRVQSLVRTRKIASFDDLVVQSRLPMRTALLVVNELVTSQRVEIPSIAGTKYFEAKAKSSCQKPSMPSNMWATNSVHNELSKAYLQLTAVREKPSLVWGQRRLIPSSAIERYFYILTLIKTESGAIAFLGDDDLVSPLIAAGLPNWRIEVIDIDRTVLNQAHSIAQQLGGSLSVHHIDLSQADSGWSNRFDIVVCDPFPSGDGSFESMFWGHAARMLRPEGMLVTTIAPSHKPTPYSAGALKMLHLLGFCPIDIQADHGKYEVFDFELTDFEKNILSELGLESNISHTKSLVTAELTHTTASTPGQAKFNFREWNLATAEHYLTLQAGLADQLKIANERGLFSTDILNLSHKGRGLRIEAVFPRNARSKMSLIELKTQPSTSYCLRRST